MALSFVLQELIVDKDERGHGRPRLLIYDMMQFEGKCIATTQIHLRFTIVLHHNALIVFITT